MATWQYGNDKYVRASVAHMSSLNALPQVPPEGERESCVLRVHSPPSFGSERTKPVLEVKIYAGSHCCPRNTPPKDS